MPLVVSAAGRTILVCGISLAISFGIGCVVTAAVSLSKGTGTAIIKLIMTLMDILGPAIPLIAIALALQINSDWLLAILLGIVSWNSVAAVLTEEIAAVRHCGFVQAAKSLGASKRRIFFVHILPLIAPRVAVLGNSMFVNAAGIFGALGFLGVASDVKKSLGFMVYDARTFLSQTPSYFYVTLLAFVAVTCIPAGLKALLSLCRKFLKFF